MRGLTDNDLMGNFGTWKIGQANRFWMSKKFTANTLNIKDDISDLAAFTSRFVPGGENAASKIQVYGDVRKTYDIEKEEVDAQVDAYWWRSCPKLAYPCKIKLYEGGTLVVVADDTDVKLDLSGADAIMDEDFDETQLDRSTNTSSGSLFTVVAFLSVAIAALYFFRKKIDGFVATHPKYAKAWSLTCKAGNMASKIVTKSRVPKLRKQLSHLQKAQNHPSRRHVPRDGGLLVSVVFLIGGMDSGTVLTNRLSAHRARLSRLATG